VLGAGVAASVRGFAGAAHAAPDIAAPNANPVVGMYGNPTAAAPFWHLQHSTDCALMAVADVVGQITRHEPTEQQITALAENTPSHFGPGPIWHRGAGTALGNVPVLLAHYGIQSDVWVTNTTAMEQNLAEGHKVIVFLNAETIWNQPGQRTNPDHAVVLTGIDTKTGVVHLNDSGIKTGRDEQVSIATFEQAGLGGHSLAVVTKHEPTPEVVTPHHPRPHHRARFPDGVPSRRAQQIPTAVTSAGL
jgi:hypothetical protein